MTRNLRIAASAILAMGTLLAQEEKQTPPPGSAPKPFAIPPKQTSTLKNGIPVTLASYGAIPKTEIVIVIRTGSADEPADKQTLAAIAGEMLKQGAASRTGEQIAEEAAKMGGAVEINAGADQTTIGGDVLSEFAPQFVALLADVVQHPTFPAGDLERIKRDFLRQVAIQRTQPGAIAQAAFRHAFYGDHPYGRPLPTDEMIQSISMDDVQKFYRQNFGAARTRIYAAGKLDASLQSAIQKAFQDWEKGSAASVNLPKPKAAWSLTVLDRPGAAQSVIRLGLPTPDPTNKDYVPLQVTNSLLGGSFASRITTNIREKKGYTYSPVSVLPTHFHEAYWVQNADVTTKVTGPALQEIFSEVNRLRREAPSKDELDHIKTYMAGLFVLQNSSRQGIVNQLSFKDFQGLDDSWLKNYVQNVMAVKPQDVQRIAESYLSPSKMTLVVVGDRKQIDEQLKGLREGPPAQ